MNPYDCQRDIRRLLGTDPDNYQAEDLKLLANGPLFDPARPFCPCYRLTMAQTIAREAAQVEFVAPSDNLAPHCAGGAAIR